MSFPLPNLNFHGGQSGAQSGQLKFDGGYVTFAPVNYDKGLPTAFVIGAALVAGYFLLKGK